MRISIAQLNPDALAASNIKIAIITNGGEGSWRGIKGYRRSLKCPFPVYMDTTRELYRAMGMQDGLDSNAAKSKERPKYHAHSIPIQVAFGVFRGLFRFPRGLPGSGSIPQLGGEVILKPDYECEWIHHMRNASDHTEAPDVARVAGCDLPTKAEADEFQAHQDSASSYAFSQSSSMAKAPLHGHDRDEEGRHWNRKSGLGGWMWRRKLRNDAAPRNHVSSFERPR